MDEDGPHFTSPWWLVIGAGVVIGGIIGMILLVIFP